MQPNVNKLLHQILFCSLIILEGRGVTESNRAELSMARVRLVNFWKGSDLARVSLFSKIQARARVRLELIKIELGSGSFV